MMGSPNRRVLESGRSVLSVLSVVLSGLSFIIYFSVFFLVGFRSVLSLQVYAIKYYTWTIFLIGVHSR